MGNVAVQEGTSVVMTNGSVCAEGTDDARIPPVSPQAVAVARELYAVRRRRLRHLPADLMGEPAWDMLLDLFLAAAEQRRVPTTSACIGAHVPPTTALRWLRIMEGRGLVEREQDGSDGRRTFVRLSAAGIRAMEPFLEAAGASLARAGGANGAAQPENKAPENKAPGNESAARDGECTCRVHSPE